MSSEHATSAEVLARALTVLAERRAHLDALEQVLTSAPDRLRDAAMGSRAAPLSPDIELLHGAEEQWTFWTRVLADPPQRPVAVLPDLAHVMSFAHDRIGEDSSAVLRTSGLRIRLVTLADQLTDVRVRERVGRFAALGIEVRTLATLPGFFLADAGGLAVMPLEWGQSTPESIVASHDMTVVAAVLALFDDLWERARPLPGVARDWDAVLALMAQGLSDGAIARTLGLSVRSVRRRIADAGEAHGAGSRFALGVEWARRDA